MKATRVRWIAVMLAGEPDRQGRRDGYIIAGDSEDADVYLDGNHHVDDVLDHGEEQPPPGIWVFEGWAWAYMSGYYEPELNSGHHGTWRRATAVELFLLARGDARPFAPEANPPPYPFADSHMEDG